LINYMFYVRTHTRARAHTHTHTHTHTQISKTKFFKFTLRVYVKSIILFRLRVVAPFLKFS